MSGVAPPARVVVAMSGGVDSSVAAALLVERGFDVTGVTLKLWGGESDSGCCSVSDVEDARRVAAQLGIRHYVFNFVDDFDARVVQPYVEAHGRAETPNPCVECNRTMKFDRLLVRAGQLGADYLATGHHARVDRGGPRALLRRGADAAKDQSYVLYMLGPEQLERVLLPVGDLTKAEVREHATRLGLRTAAKPESMDVCFIRRGERSRFLAARLAPAPGPVVDRDGTVVGTHAGIAGFTVGQRRGVGVALGERRFVVDVDPVRATVRLGTREDLLRDEIALRDTVLPDDLATDAVVTVQTSAHGAPVRGRLVPGGVRLFEPRPRVAPGQVVALYRGDLVLGGGIAAA